MTATLTGGRRAARQAREELAAREEKARQKRFRRRRFAVWTMLVLLTVLGLAVVAGYPLRTWYDQRTTIGAEQHQLDLLRSENDALAARIAALDTDAEIERLARERYNLVKPGEEVYPILPAPPPPVSVPAVWPFTQLAPKLSASGH